MRKTMLESLRRKVVLGEFQRPAIFADGPDGLLGETVGHCGLDFDGDLNIGHELTNEVLNHFARDLAHVTIHAGSVDFHRRVEAFRFCRLSPRRRRCRSAGLWCGRCR